MVHSEQDVVIFADKVSKAFDGVTAVSEVTLTVPPGVIFGFIGPSGCGKTTMVRLMLGIYSIDSGTIDILNQSPDKFKRSEQATIGYMPQHLCSILN